MLKYMHRNVLKQSERLGFYNWTSFPFYSPSNLISKTRGPKKMHVFTWFQMGESTPELYQQRTDPLFLHCVFVSYIWNRVGWELELRGFSFNTERLSCHERVIGIITKRRLNNFGDVLWWQLPVFKKALEVRHWKNAKWSDFLGKNWGLCLSTLRRMWGVRLKACEAF